MLLTALVGVVLASLPASGPAEPTSQWVEQVQAWRAAREAELRKPDGWLSVAGLYFLREGVNSIGSNPAADLRLPSDTAPSDAGRLVYEGERVRFEPAAGVDAMLNDHAITGPVDLARADATASRPADRLVIGRISLQLHESGARLGVRLRDPESTYRRNFTGLRWFLIDAAWRVPGRLVPYDAPRQVEIQNVLGDVESLNSPGEVEVVVNGTTVRLIALQASRGRLWLIFSDTTAGALTYRIRFLYVEAPDAAGRVDVDFNRAYNPPCAFNPHTTCPLPPRQNRLTVAIKAGEQNYSGPLEHSAKN